MKRSAELKKGCRAIFALAVLVGILLVAVAGSGALPGSVITRSVWGGGLIGAMPCFIPVAFCSVRYAVVYHDLGTPKEGVSIDKLAKVFDLFFLYQACLVQNFYSAFAQI